MLSPSRRGTSKYNPPVNQTSGSLKTREFPKRRILETLSNQSIMKNQLESNMNLTHTQRKAKQAYLQQQQEQMLSHYEKADTSERNAIIGHINSFLSTCNQSEKTFWLQFRRKLEKLNESAVLFPLGCVYMTVGAKEALEESNQMAEEFLARHQSGDWGIVGKEDSKENDLSVKEGFRILSAYKTSSGVKIWVLTEANRSATTILLPSEY